MFFYFFNNNSIATIKLAIFVTICSRSELQVREKVVDLCGSTTPPFTTLYMDKLWQSYEFCYDTSIIII